MDGNQQIFLGEYIIKTSTLPAMYLGVQGQIPTNFREWTDYYQYFEVTNTHRGSCSDLFGEGSAYFFHTIPFIIFPHHIPATFIKM